MLHEEFNLPSIDKFPLWAQTWYSSEPTRAAICLVHGLGEHSTRYQHIAHYFCQNGYAFTAFDLRGHGNSPGKRGHISHIDLWMDDIDSLIRESQRRYPGVPHFLFGHSLGGLQVLNYGLRRKQTLKGIIASAPGLRSPITNQKFKVFLTKHLAQIFPTLSIHTGLETEAISHDPVIVDRYRKDPLVHDVSTLSLAKAGLNAVDYALENADKFHYPLLILHGTADRIVFPSGSQEFSRKAGDCCTLILFDGLFHELHNEPENEIVFKKVISWIEERISKP